jgi:hypothetical protein
VTAGPRDTRARDLGRRPFRGRGPLDRLWPVWAGLAVGPLAWAAAVTASYAVVPAACDAETALPLHLIRLVTLAAAVAAAAVAFRLWRDTRGRRRDRVDDESFALAPVTIDRTAFLALLGVALSGMSAILIAVEGIANFVVSPCL